MSPSSEFARSRKPVTRPPSRAGGRVCSRPGCPAPPIATLTFRYVSRQAWLEPLADDPAPSSYDLCGRHADRTNPPNGWELVDDRPDAPGPAHHVGDAQTVAAVAAALHATEPGAGVAPAATTDQQPAEPPPVEPSPSQPSPPVDSDNISAALAELQAIARPQSAANHPPATTRSGDDVAAPRPSVDLADVESTAHAILAALGRMEHHRPVADAGDVVAARPSATDSGEPGAAVDAPSSTGHEPPFTAVGEGPEPAATAGAEDRQDPAVPHQGAPAAVELTDRRAAPRQEGPPSQVGGPPVPADLIVDARELDEARESAGSSGQATLW